MSASEMRIGFTASYGRERWEDEEHLRFRDREGRILKLDEVVSLLGPFVRHVGGEARVEFVIREVVKP